MKRFDFMNHYSRIEKAVDEDEVIVIRREHDEFRDSLSDVEREQFRADFDRYLKWSLDRATFEIAFLKEMLTYAQPA